MNDQSSVRFDFIVQALIQAVAFCIELESSTDDLVANLDLCHVQNKYKGFAHLKKFLQTVSPECWTTVAVIMQSSMIWACTQPSMALPNRSVKIYCYAA